MTPAPPSGWHPVGIINGHNHHNITGLGPPVKRAPWAGRGLGSGLSGQEGDGGVGDDTPHPSGSPVRRLVRGAPKKGGAVIPEGGSKPPRRPSHAHGSARYSRVSGIGVRPAAGCGMARRALRPRGGHSEYPELDDSPFPKWVVRRNAPFPMLIHSLIHSLIHCPSPIAHVDHDALCPRAPGNFV